MSTHEPFNGIEILKASPRTVHEFLVNLEERAGEFYEIK